MTHSPAIFRSTLSTTVVMLVAYLISRHAYAADAGHAPIPVMIVGLSH